MTELSFLIDLLLNQRLSKPVKDLIANRIREIESKPQASNSNAIGHFNQFKGAVPPHLAGQSPSTIANMLREGLPAAPVISAAVAQDEPPQQPVIVAATPVAAQAVAHRQQAIAQAMSGKPEPGRTSPRKF